MNKIVLINKPSGWTSFDVVAKIRGAARRITGDKKIKVGHAGTLDPFATGLLIVLVGKDATKRQDEFMKQDKEYEATLRLGFVSTTGDPEGEIIKQPQVSEIEIEKVEAALAKFRGEISQVPPVYSAIKVNGERAYKLARAGKDVEMKPRVIMITEIKVIHYLFPELKILVKCSSGTYIRSLAEDIGKALGTGAYLTGLKRTQIGRYKLKEAKTVDEVLVELGEG